jgi:hypothetical protein
MSTSARARTVRASTAIAAVGLLVTPALLVLYLVGSLVLTGGNVMPGGSPNWDEVYPSPVFPVPGWLVVVPTVVGSLSAVVVVGASRTADASRLIGLLGYTFGAALSEIAFLFVFAGDTRIWDTGYGIGFAAAALASAAVLIAVLTLAPGAERLRRAELARAGVAPSERSPLTRGERALAIGMLLLGVAVGPFLCVGTVGAWAAMIATGPSPLVSTLAPVLASSSGTLLCLAAVGVSVRQLTRAAFTTRRAPCGRSPGRSGDSR